MKLSKIFLFISVLIISCNSPAKKTITKTNVKKDSVKHIAIHNVKHVLDTLAIPDDTIPKVTIPVDAIQVQEDSVDPLSKIKILEESDYNAQDGVGPKDAKLNWIGIFYAKDQYFIKPVKIRFIKEHSEMDEKDDQKTGWGLKVEDKDTCFKIISGMDSVVTGPIKTFKAPYIYYAGQKVIFNYEGVMYTLYTTGTKRKGGLYDVGIYNCKLYIMANVKGHIFNQLLRSLGNDVDLNGGGDMSNSLDLEFIGDIDGDKIPDFIIGGSGFPFGEDYLYLSKPAGDKAIVKLAAYFYVSD